MPSPNQTRQTLFMQKQGSLAHLHSLLIGENAASKLNDHAYRHEGIKGHGT